MNDSKEHTSITPESVLASVEAMFAVSSERLDRELQKSRAEFDQRNAESSERLDRELQKSRAEFDQRFEKSDRLIKDLGKQIGGMANSNGDYAEEFFYNALYHGQRNLFGEVFDEVVKRNTVTINKGYEDEYDILLVNGKAICVVEVKYKADSGDLPHRVLRKAQTFRVNFPQHKDKKVYLALAGMSFHPLTEKACKDNGIAIMKQVGDAMVVTDENLKTF
jgi:hypothetical protein